MLPVLHPDMTLYSLVAIAHRWGGSSRGEQPSSALFGSPHAGLRHDFPSHLDEFCRRTGSAFGHPEDIALNATVLPYFLRFRPPEVQTTAVALMRSETVESLKFVLGLPAGPSGASMPLCSCMDCVLDDIAAHGLAYWHRQHQLPGVFVCPNHGSPIRQSSIRIGGRGRSTLFLPDDPEIIDTNTSTITCTQRPILLRLATLSAAALDRPLPGGYSPQILLATYQHGLKQQGLLTPSGQVRAGEFIKWLRDRYNSIAALGSFNRIIDEYYVEGMLRLVRKPRRNFHSACHLLLIDALFGSWEMFTSVYTWENQMELPLPLPEETGPEEEHLPSEHEKIAHELARRYKEGQGSVSALSRELGIDLNTAMRWLGKLGLIEVPRRPRVLTQEIRTEIIQSIKRGEPLRNISSSFSLSRSTIDRICNEQPNLQREWREANHERKRLVERAKLEILIRCNPDITHVELRRTPESGYRWLSRHDREWLKIKVPVKTAQCRNQVTTRRPRVDWAARDRECLSALKELEPTLHFEDSERLQPMVVMLRKLPKLTFTPRLDRLPESRTLVTEILVRAKARRNK